MKSGRVAWVVGCVIAAGCSAIAGRAADVPQKAAAIQSDVLTNLPAGKYPRPLKCDSQGNMYVLGPVPNSGEATGLAGIQVTRLDATGKLVATFPPQLPSGIEGPARFVDFAGDGTGGAFGLIDSMQETGGVPKKRSGPYLAKFSSDGNVDSVSTMDIGDRLIPRRLEAMAAGQLFVAGVDRIDRSMSAAIFDSNGRNPTKVEGTARLEKTLTGDALSALRESLREGSVAAGTDGYVYVVGRSPRPVVLVISSNGQLIRYFFVRPPDPNFTAVGALQNGTRLAIAFAAKGSGDASVIRLVDTTTREVQADYVLGSQLKGQLVCYAANGSFSILITEGDGDRFRLKTVAP